MTIFDQDDGLIWVQPGGPNSICYELPCADTDGIQREHGATATSMCRVGNRWVSKGRRRGIPGESTMSIAMYLSDVETWLQRQAVKGCPLPVYIHKGPCNSGTFLDYMVGELGQNGIVISEGEGGMVRGMAEAGDGVPDKSVTTSELSMAPYAPRYYKLSETARSIVEAEPLRDIAFCNEAQCAGICGASEDLCEDGIITADFTTIGEADTWFTVNGWAVGTVGATFPFAADEAVTAAVCFKIDQNTTRHVIFCGTTDGGVPCKCGYTDNAGATWTPVIIGTVNGGYFPHGGCAFSLDGKHTWCCDDLGAVFFSDDNCQTWTNQAAPYNAGGAESLYAINFIDKDFGMCVGGTTGASSVFMWTNDGGTHWTIGTGPIAKICTGVAVLNSYYAWVIEEDGTVWYTSDFGTAWAQRTMPLVMTAGGDVDALDDFCLAVCGNYNDGVNDHGIVYRTFNGGYDWEYFIYDTTFDGALQYYGLNSMEICDYNHIFAVGEPVNSLGIIFEIVGQSA